jgi:hypothetical protein
MNASSWLENAVLNHFFRNTPTTPPAQVFLGLFTSNPTDDNTGIEVMGGAYARRQIVFTAPEQVDGRGQIQNNAELRFPLATANWGNISHFGIFTDATGGNLLAHGTLPTPKLIETGDEAVFRQNSLKVTLD